MARVLSPGSGAGEEEGPTKGCMAPQGLHGCSKDLSCKNAGCVHAGLGCVEPGSAGRETTLPRRVAHRGVPAAEQKPSKNEQSHTGKVVGWPSAGGPWCGDGGKGTPIESRIWGTRWRGGSQVTGPKGLELGCLKGQKENRADSHGEAWHGQLGCTQDEIRPAVTGGVAGNVSLELVAAASGAGIPSGAIVEVVEAAGKGGRQLGRQKGNGPRGVGESRRGRPQRRGLREGVLVSPGAVHSPRGLAPRQKALGWTLLVSTIDFFF